MTPQQTYERAKAWKRAFESLTGRSAIYEIDVDTFLHRESWGYPPGKSYQVQIYPIIDFGHGRYPCFETYEDFFKWAEDVEARAKCQCTPCSYMMALHQGLKSLDDIPEEQFKK